MLSYQDILWRQAGHMLRPLAIDISLGYLHVTAEMKEPKINPKEKEINPIRIIIYSGTHSAHEGRDPEAGDHAVSLGLVQVLLLIGVPLAVKPPFADKSIILQADVLVAEQLFIRF